MNNYLPQKYNNNFLNKFFGFIRKVFFRKKDESNEINNEIKYSSEDNFNERIKVEVDYKTNKENEKNDFMEYIKNNPDLLENFTCDRLEKMLKIIKDENNKKRETLKKLTI